MGQLNTAWLLYKIAHFKAMKKMNFFFCLSFMLCIFENSIGDFITANFRNVLIWLHIAKLWFIHFFFFSSNSMRQRNTMKIVCKTEWLEWLFLETSKTKMLTVLYVICFAKMSALIALRTLFFFLISGLLLAILTFGFFFSCLLFVACLLWL